jgi:hypothetical protein
LSGATSGWHTYAADWEPGVVTWYYDGKQVWQYTTGIVSNPMFLILNLALNANPSAVPASLRVDYVRVWQKTGTATATPAPTSTPRPANTPTALPPTTTPAPTSTPSPANTPTALPPTATPVNTTGTTINNVFLILEESYPWSAVHGNSSSPYITSLLPQASYATQYFAPPDGTLLSLPQYLWIEAGTSFGINDDNDPSQDSQSTTAHLVTLLKNAGITWKAYQEGISGTNCPTTNTGLYAVRHEPFMYFQDVTSNSTYCTQHMRPYTELATDLASGNIARYNFITPNLCDDMHDNCTGDPVRQGDDWLKANLPTILASPAYQNNGAVLITWDNSDASASDPIGMIVLSPSGKGGGYSNAIHYDHSSLLHTLERVFRVSPLLGGAASAADLGDLFKSGALP